MESQPPIIDLEEGWSYINDMGITKHKRILDGEPEPKFTCTQYMNLYTTIYKMCTQRSPHDYSKQLYDRYRVTIEDHCKQTVLPSLKKKHGENMLKELVLRWSNHTYMVDWLSRLFSYVDRYFVTRSYLPTLNQVGLKCFRDLVYNEMKSKATEAVIALIHREREGEVIDKELLKKVLEMYVEMGMGHMDKYVVDFETFMLQDTTTYYSRKASSWIHEYSCPNQDMPKYEESLKKERERVTHYLHLSTEPKLVKVLKEVFESLGNKAENLQQFFFFLRQRTASEYIHVLSLFDLPCCVQTIVCSL